MSQNIFYIYADIKSETLTEFSDSSSDSSSSDSSSESSGSSSTWNVRIKGYIEILANIWPNNTRSLNLTIQIYSNSIHLRKYIWIIDMFARIWNYVHNIKYINRDARDYTFAETSGPPRWACNCKRFKNLGLYQFPMCETFNKCLKLLLTGIYHLKKHQFKNSKFNKNVMSILDNMMSQKQRRKVCIWFLTELDK